MAGTNEMELHDVRSEILEELHPLRTGLSRGTVLLHVRERHKPARIAGPKEDMDGDVVVPRKRRRRARSRDDEAEDDGAAQVVWSIEAMRCSGVDATGVQLWRAAMLMAEFVESVSCEMRNSVVVELGAGVGFVSLVAAKSALVALATDCDVSALGICERNASQHSQCGNVRVRHFDWSVGLRRDASDAADHIPSRFQLNDDDRALLNGGIDWILASDVFYDDNLTDVFLDTLHALILHNPRSQVIIAAERRVVFSAITLSEISLGFDTFQSRLCAHSPPASPDPTNVVACTECTRDTPHFIAIPIPMASVPHIFDYNRMHTLTLWRVQAVVIAA